MPTTVAVTSTRAVVEAAARRGVDTDALLARHALSPQLLADRDARLPAPVVDAVWRDAIATSDEPELPVWAALELAWGAYRVIDALAAASRDVGEALAGVATYFRIVNDSVRLAVEPAGRGAVLTLVDAGGGPIPGPYVDYTLTACIHRVSRVARAPLRPRVQLRRSRPDDLRAHRLAFGGELHFGARADRVLFTPEGWRAPMEQGDAVLREVLRDHADALLAALSPADPLEDVREALIDELPRGRAELVLIASRMGTSKRTLQRRLADAGTSWSDLLTGVRRELAAQLLADPELSIDDVAVLLGYAEASTFHRAFRRWTGQTPGAWRSLN